MSRFEIDEAMGGSHGFFYCRGPREGWRGSGGLSRSRGLQAARRGSFPGGGRIKTIEKRRERMESTKVVLADQEIPRQWYNIQADLPKPMSPRSIPEGGDRRLPEPPPDGTQGEARLRQPNVGRRRIPPAIPGKPFCFNRNFSPVPRHRRAVNPLARRRRREFSLCNAQNTICPPLQAKNFLAS